MVDLPSETDGTREVARVERRTYRARAQGGYVRVFAYLFGVQQSDPIAVKSRTFGEQIANALNKAYEAGVADGTADGRSEGREKVIKVLSDLGMTEAASKARQHPM